MTNQFDQAQKFEEQHRCRALERMASAQQVSVGPVDCAGCEDKISEDRRKAMPGTRLCITCALERER